jgi:hypothetical protein
VTVGREITVEAEIQNFGTQDQPDQRIVFLVDEQQVHSEDVQVPAGGQLTATFRYTFTTPGEHQVEVRLSDDALPVDNHRWLSMPVRDTVDVLCVEGRRGAASFLAYALDPNDSLPSRVLPKIRLENALLEEELSEYDCIFLCNVGRFSREETAVLTSYVQAGGGLVITLGDQVQAANYNEQLGSGAVGKRLLPARLGKIVAETQVFFDPLEYRHPIVAPFADHERSGLLTTPVWRYFQAEPFDDGTAQVALAFQNGDPAIIEQRLQRGRIILLTTAVSPDSVDRSTDPPTPWTLIASWPSFPPLVQEILALAARGRYGYRNVLVGEPIVGAIQAVRPGVSLTIRQPDGTNQRVQMQIEDETSNWLYGDTMISGVYTARYGPPLDQSQRFAVNVNTRESNLERFDIELLPSQFNQDFRTDEAAVAVPATRPTQYFRYFLGLVLLLLLLETFLAWHFGNASA